MGRLITYEEYMNMLSERVLDNSRQLKRDVHQRRNGMEDLYGVCFTANGDASNPATFYISLSPDYVYLERFAFKFVIKPFTSSVAGVGGGEDMTIGSTSLSINVNSTHRVLDGTSTLDDSTSGVITPNPHTHSASGGTGGLNYGIKKINTTSKNWRVRIDGIDITEYLITQHDGSWISGEGIYPNNRLEDIEDFYDILEVCSTLTDEGQSAKRDQILASRFKKIEIVSDAQFAVDAYLYMKYTNLNR